MVKKRCVPYVCGMESKGHCWHGACCHRGTSFVREWARCLQLTIYWGCATDTKASDLVLHCHRGTSFVRDRARCLQFTIYLRLARTIYIRCIYGIFGRGITTYTVIYGGNIQFWPTLNTLGLCNGQKD